MEPISSRKANRFPVQTQHPLFRQHANFAIFRALQVVAVVAAGSGEPGVADTSDEERKAGTSETFSPRMGHGLHERCDVRERAHRLHPSPPYSDSISSTALVLPASSLWLAYFLQTLLGKQLTETDQYAWLP
jgi:hypothetical protein